jgi:hypothetical protein
MRWTLLLLVGAAACGPALAQSVDPSVTTEDRQAIAGCLSESGNMARACIGTVAVVCSRQGGGDPREQGIACSRREAGIWRERLDFAMNLLAQRLESGARSRFAAVQRSWEGYSAQKCAFVAEIQTPERAPVMQAGCELRETALRAIEVERWTRRQGQAERPRPRIQR